MAAVPVVRAEAPCHQLPAGLPADTQAALDTAIHSARNRLTVIKGAATLLSRRAKQGTLTTEQLLKQLACVDRNASEIAVALDELFAFGVAENG